MDRSEGLSQTIIPYDRTQIALIFDEFARNNFRKCPEEVEPSDTLKELVERSLSQVKLERKDVLLDVGSGPGNVANRAARHCEWVYGIDISREGLKLARLCSKKLDVHNTTFVYGALEEPSIELDLKTVGINKILVLRSISHLPDALKEICIKALVGIIKRPGRIVIGDQMFFESPDDYQDDWDEVCYDGGLTDQPAEPTFLDNCLTKLGAKTSVIQIHPLAGVITADFAK